MKTENTEIKSFIDTGNRYVKTYGERYYNPSDSFLNYSSTQIGFRLRSRSSSKNTNVPFVKDLSVESLKLAGETFTINRCFTDLIEELKISEELLGYTEDWDGFGAKALDKALLVSAISYLIEYSTFVYNEYSIIIQAPEINLCPNGSLDLSWKTSNARLLINLKDSDRVIGRFYNYTKTTSGLEELKNEKEGTIDVRTFDESLAVWMKNLK